MTDFLLTESMMKSVCEGLDEAVELVDCGQNIDAEARRALLFYHVLSKEATVRTLFPALSVEEIFYNRYFWLLTFSMRVQKASGYDAGVEQQVFKLLETAPHNIDWTCVERVANAAAAANA